MKTKTTTATGGARAYSYIRFSTADQIKGDSLRRQTEATAQWCQANGVELVNSYRDLGVSAWKGKNASTGALAAFLKLARDKRIQQGSYLVIESLDRLSRNSIMEAFDLFREIMKAGIRLVTLSDGHIYDADKINNGGFTDLIISLTIMSRGNEESRVKSQRVAAAWANKRRHADEMKLTKCCAGWLELTPDRKGFRQIPGRVAVVRSIFKQASEGVSIHGIARKLREEGAETFGRGKHKAKCWSAAYVCKLLDSRAVLGEFTPATKVNGQKKYLDTIPDYYPAVISRELFATVSQLRGIRPSYRGRGQYNVFSKMAFDRETGDLMTYVNRDRAKGYHYLLNSAALVQRAPYVTWQYDDFKASFLAVCHKVALAKAAPVEKDTGALAVAKMDLGETEKQIANCARFIAKGASPAMESVMRELEASKLVLQQRIATLESQTAARPPSVAKVDWRDDAALRENLRATVKRITVDAKARWFKAEFLDGRVGECQRQGDSFVITTPV